MPVVTGTASDEELQGAAGADTLFGLGGDDTLAGGAGNDMLVGGEGQDRFVLGAVTFGIDTIPDFAAGDLIDVSALGLAEFADLLPFLGQSSSGDATLGFTLEGVAHRLTLLGIVPEALTAAHFVFNTSADGLDAAGGAGEDLLFGGLGNDRVDGAAGADTLIGGQGADTLLGGDGNDRLQGGAGEDHLAGGRGIDSLTGGDGSDRFVIDRPLGGHNVQTIADFEAGDVLDLSAFGVVSLDDLMLVMGQQTLTNQPSPQVNILPGSGMVVILDGTTLASLAAAQFAFDTDHAPRDLLTTADNHVLFGGNAGDWLTGTIESERLAGAGGNDTLVGGGGGDLLSGGARNDLFVIPAFDQVYEFSPFYYYGRSGHDTITDFAAGDVVDLSAHGVPDLAALRPLMVQDGSDVVLHLLYNPPEPEFGAGVVFRNTTLAAFTEASFIFDANPADRVVQATDYRNVLFGYVGNDRLIGGGTGGAMIGGDGNDTISLYDGDAYLSGGDGDDVLTAGYGHDTIDGGAGDNRIEGGDTGYAYLEKGILRDPAIDTVQYLDFGLDQLSLAPLPGSYRPGLLVTRHDGPGGTALGTDTLTGVEYIQTRDGLLDVGTGRQGLFSTTRPVDSTNALILGTVYEGPVAGLDWQLLGSGAGEIFGGTASDDFINGLGGDDAIHAGDGNDVIDGGTGSNFLTGGAGRDTFFLDGRGGTATWSTITDWQAREQLSIWGYRPEASVLSWAAEDGTAGYRGVTLHADLNGDGTVETSVTWTGRTQADLPVPLPFDGLLWFT
jgi:Ca2+-binding RTX toxin-like protein